MSGLVAGDFGVTSIVVQFVDSSDAPVDVSSYTTKQIWMGNPTLASFTASFTTDGTDGKIEYALLTGDIAAGDFGTWKVRGLVSKAGAQLSTQLGIFVVHE